MLLLHSAVFFYINVSELFVFLGCEGFTSLLTIQIYAFTLVSIVSVSSKLVVGFDLKDT